MFIYIRHSPLFKLLLCILFQFSVLFIIPGSSTSPSDVQPNSFLQSSRLRLLSFPLLILDFSLRLPGVGLGFGSLQTCLLASLG